MLDIQSTTEIAHLVCERALDELRRQMGLLIQTDDTTVLATCGAEFADMATLAAFKRLPAQRHFLLLSGPRAYALGLSSGNSVAIDLQPLSHAVIQLLINPLPAGSLPAELPIAAYDDTLLLPLAKRASLLPALLVAEGGVELANAPELAAWQFLDVEHIRIYMREPMIEAFETAQATLPLLGAEHAVLHSFRLRYCAAVHLALVIGDISSDEAPLTRIHSSCVTGDILGSLRCDCGDQLRLALDAIKTEGKGVLLYMHQEGRGIGITNKLRAYQMQERGLDTFDANLALGFSEDERDFAAAAAMLKQLGIARIRLLTNNPRKLMALEAAGIAIRERKPLIAPPGAHNRAYLDAKSTKSGHML